MPFTDNITENVEKKNPTNFSRTHMSICVKDVTPLRDSTDKEYERPEYETKCFPNQSSRLWREGPGGG